MKSTYDDKSWSFLIADVDLEDDIFSHSVILVLEDSPNASFGIILNKPIYKTLGQMNPNFINTPLANIPTFIGGPVCPDKFSIVIFHKDEKENKSNFSFGVKADFAENYKKDHPTAKIVAFMGYSSWKAGQLQAEIKDKTWLTSPVNEDFILIEDGENIWKKAICSIKKIYTKFPKPFGLDYRQN
ncbi:MAG: YqgE/AlgH family protein [Opitutales bacterium]